MSRFEIKADRISNPATGPWRAARASLFSRPSFTVIPSWLMHAGWNYLGLNGAGAAICPAHNLVPTVASLAIGALLSQADITLLQPSLTVDDLPGTLNHFDIRLRLSKRPVEARAPHAAVGFPPH
ncbi:hypothetical protein [Rhizobium anhuiense]|uniref:hypothetical protein n=1 Tax=Rhizobium anhuiense TaxID=1184720 RepID=UPI001FED8A8C|nr:hypothetical protein [Rhizobium anhuiense]